MNRRLVGLTIVTAGVVAFAVGDGDDPDVATAAPTAVPAVTPAIGTDATTAVQRVLAGYGYTIAVDGIYGPQTTRVVKSWQRSNGLVVDGIAGPITQASLGVVNEGADRAPAPVPVGTPRSVEQIIRDVWPDDLEDRALAIAWRESNYRPDVTSPSGCCHGVFQLHEIHLGWMGVDVAALFDAETNVRLAYALYQRDGWRPWAL